MKNKILYLSLFLVTLLCSCSSGASVEDDLRAAEMAIANGDMVSAESATRHIVGSKNFSGLTSKQLARLSMVYIQMADSLDREDNMGQAANYYRRAYETNSDSASEFYSTLPPDHMPYAMILRALTQPCDTSVVDDGEFLYSDSIPEM